METNSERMDKLRGEIRALVPPEVMAEYANVDGLRDAMAAFFEDPDEHKIGAVMAVIGMMIVNIDECVHLCIHQIGRQLLSIGETLMSYAELAQAPE